MLSSDGSKSKATIGLKHLYWPQKLTIVSFLLPASSADRADQSQTNSSPWSVVPVNIVLFSLRLKAIWDPPIAPPPSGRNKWNPYPAFQLIREY